MKTGTHDPKWAGQEWDAPLTTAGFDLMCRRSVASTLRSRYPKLACLLEDPPAADGGRVDGPGRTPASASAEAPRSIVLYHQCEGGDCDMAKDYTAPVFAAGKPNGDDEDTSTTSDTES